jgi:hypothetical protein
MRTLMRVGLIGCSSRNIFRKSIFQSTIMTRICKISLGSMSMEEYENKLLGLLKYVRFIKDEKVKIHRFLSGISSFYK